MACLVWAFFSVFSLSPHAIFSAPSIKWLFGLGGLLFTSYGNARIIYNYLPIIRPRTCDRKTKTQNFVQPEYCASGTLPSLAIVR
jgi:hypothetical protein